VVEKSRRAWQAHALVSFGAGVDTNAGNLALGDVDRAPSSGASGSSSSLAPFAATSATLGGGYHGRGRALSELEYSLIQIAYADRALDGYSFQDHSLEWLNEVWAGGRVRLRLPIRTGISLTGLRDKIAPFQWTATWF